ncbi:hypothetical protein GL2_30140 [Microbulbifer sp. GL-2]|nr:hypothetical protein GL2_30140 [Microbulbifer sp. GL-2]
MVAFEVARISCGQVGSLSIWLKVGISRCYKEINLRVVENEYSNNKIFNVLNGFFWRYQGPGA